MLYLSQSCGTKRATQVPNLGNVIRMKELRYAICYLFNKKKKKKLKRFLESVYFKTNKPVFRDCYLRQFPPKCIEKSLQA